MEWYQILVIGFLSFPIAYTVIVEGPKSAVYPEGTNITLQCIANYVRNRIVWEDIKENTVIFIDKTKNTQRAKFENFFISDAEENFSLTIVNAQLSDDGFYSCEEGDESRNANVTIEAEPDLSVFVNNTQLEPEDAVTLTEDDQVIVTCKAEGAKPAVHLTLKFGENEWIETNNITRSEDGLRFTTEVTVTHPVSRDDTTVTCKATGLISIPPSYIEISINVLHKPVCHLDLKRNTAECQCVSNPQVSEYKWYVDGTLQGTELLLQFHDYIPANLTCLATNAVGTGALASRYVSSTNVNGATSTYYVIIVIAAVIACGIIVCSVIFYCLYKRRREKLKYYAEREPLSDATNAVGDTSELGGRQSSLSKDDVGEDKDAEGDKSKPGGGQSTVKSENDGEHNEVQGANSKQEEKKTSEDSEDEQPFVDAPYYFIKDEKEKNTTDQRGNVDDDSKGNSGDTNGENDALLSKDKESNDVTQSNSAGEISNKQPVVSQGKQNSYDPWGEEQNENERNPPVTENENNKNEDTVSPNRNVTGNDIKQSEQGSTSQDKSTHDADDGTIV